MAKPVFTDGLLQEVSSRACKTNDVAEKGGSVASAEPYIFPLAMLVFILAVSRKVRHWHIN